jgi:hypothetical protein
MAHSPRMNRRLEALNLQCGHYGREGEKDGLKKDDQQASGRPENSAPVGNKA